MPAIAYPALGFATEEGTVLRWCKEVGETVSAGDDLVELAAEKAINVIPAPADGALLAIYAPPGAIVGEGETLGWLGAAGEQAPHHACRLRGWAAEIAPPPPDLATRLAEQAPPPPRAPLAAPRQRPSKAFRTYLRNSIQPVTARRMTRSWEAPKVDLFAEVDFSRVVAHREAQRAGGRERPSYNLYIAHAVTRAFADHPELNCHWLDGRRHPLHQVHVGVAVELGTDLITVSLKDVGGATLEELQRRFKGLIKRSVGMSLGLDELFGSSLTVTNLGEFEVSKFTAVLNPPEVFILAIGSLEERVVAIAGQPAVRPMCTFCLSFDHRAVDGAPASRFLRRIKYHLEHYEGDPVA